MIIFCYSLIDSEYAHHHGHHHPNAAATAHAPAPAASAFTATYAAASAPKYHEKCHHYSLVTTIPAIHRKVLRERAIF